MATTKITDLTAYTDPVNTDVLPIVDVTSDVTKKVSIANVMKNASLGTAAAPGISFDGDPNTGIYSPGADQVAISTGGSGRLFVDASGRVGVGVSSPQSLFHVDGDATAIRVTRGSAIGFAYNTGTAATDSFRIQSNGGSVDLLSAASQPITLSAGGSEKVRITSAGLVGVGTSAPVAGAQLTVAGSALAVTGQNTDHSANSIRIGEEGSGAAQIRCYGPNTSTNGSLTFRMSRSDGSNSQDVVIDGSGRLGIGTSSPSGYIHIQGTSTGTETYGRFTTGSASGDQSLVIKSGSSRDHMAIQVSTNAGVADDLALQPDGGRVGIGSTLAGNANNRTLIRSDSASAISNVLLLNNGPADNNAGQGVRINLSGVSEANSNIRYAYIESATATGSNDHYIAFGTNSAAATPLEAVRIDSSRRLLVGTSSAPTVGDTQYGLLRTQGNTSSASGFGVFSIGRGQAPASITSGSELGHIYFTANDGSGYASISGYSDAAGGTNDYPGRLVFSTTADGASSPTTRMTIKNNGQFQFETGGNGFYIFGLTSGAGTNAVKWSSSTGLLTYDSSSRLVKENIEDCPYGIAEIKQLQPRKYFRKDDQKEEVGFVADEVANVLPEFVPMGAKSVVTLNSDDTEIIPLAVNYDKLTAVLTKALQEAIAKIEILEAKVAALESA